MIVLQMMQLLFAIYFLEHLYFFRLLKTKYYIADEAAASGNYDIAVSAFVSLGDYSDSVERVLALKYNHAVSLRESGDFSAAADEFAGATPVTSR